MQSAARYILVSCLVLAAACSHPRRDDSLPPLDASGLAKDLASGDGSFVSTQGEGGTCGTHCSFDTHSVLDCAGNTVATCASGQACGNGICEDACQAAVDTHSAVGCEYYAMNPPVYTQSCYAAYIANTSPDPIGITVDYNGASLDVTKFAYTPAGSGSNLTYNPLTGMLPSGAIAILFLSYGNIGLAMGNCPGATAASNAGFVQTGTGQAFHIKTTEPVIAYDIFPFGGGSSYVSSATLLLPVSVWDVNYVAITAYPETLMDVPMDGIYYDPWISFVAASDSTHVTVQPPFDIVGGVGVTASAAHVAATYTMSAGEVLRLSQPDDLSGTTVVSDKPIGVWGGNDCANLPMGISYGDGMHQQIPPVKALGHEYAAVRYRNRVPNMEETPPWRIMGVVDGTVLTYDPPQLTAPQTLDSGVVTEFYGAGPFVVKSQDAMHPFYFGAHMTGCGELGDSSPVGCAGDPEFVNVIPPEQYLEDYVFFTDPTYPETDLVFVRARDGQGNFADVTLDCVGTLTGWMPVESNDDYEYTRADLVTGNFAKVGNCDNGRHEASSQAPFTITVWGWGSSATGAEVSTAVSYAYPAGAGVKNINTVVVPIQ